ncbi:Glyoxylase, beta-lactamase superfamily II [Friedmanniella luteola]|uniref:Glyoxylase, beta-lactamase superfamily II n=1 Tax=Friedmanniella luteola TaxID=546871 RepID=A0A1H1UEI5_9ACTN|nr:Glyoxylase, beta-lactamase superfamily II [Friedmanniella luteola]
MAPILPDTVAVVFIASFPAGPWQTNCYVVATAPGSECVVVDPGLGAVPGVQELVAEHRLKPVAVLVTHGHLDHTFSVTPLCAGNDATCWVHPRDRALLGDPYRAMGPDARALVEQLAGPTTFTEPDAVRELVDGTRFEVAGLAFDALHAPGHTPGSTMLRTDYPGTEVEAVMFSGDVLFAGSIGRTDLPGGSHLDMLDSLRTKVLPLPDPVAVLPGHGPQTTMAAERAQNPYLQASYLRAPNPDEE